MAGPDIKWTAGPGPAPLPYSKRAREAMGVTDDDKPWAHPDPPAAESWGFGGGGESDALREGRLRTNLFLIVLLIIFAIWVYRKVVKRDHSAFFHASPTPSQSEDVKVSEEDMRTAREARLKRFQETKTSYADMMKEAAGDGLLPRPFKTMMMAGILWRQKGRDIRMGCDVGEGATKQQQAESIHGNPFELFGIVHVV